LGVTASGATGTYTYSWTSIPVGFTSNLQSPPPVSPVVNTKYIAHVTSGSQQLNDTAQVTVDFVVLASATPASITIGQSSQLDATPLGGSGTYTYVWTSIPPGFNSTAKNPIVSPTQTTQYIVQCNDGALTRLDTTIVSVTLNTLTAQATATPSSTCAGQTTQLNVTAAGGSLSYTYSWTSIPPGFTSNIQNPQAQPTVTTQYIAHVNDGFSTVTDTTEVIVTPLPTAFAGPDTTYCTWAVQIPLEGTATSYSSVLWSTSGTGTFSSTTSLTGTYYPSAQDKTNGTVNLTLTVFPLSPCVNAVGSTRHLLFDPCTGLQESPEEGFSMTVSPNPSHGLFVLTINGVKKQDLKISVSDLEGNSILNTNLRSTQSTFIKWIDLSQFAKGVYVVKIQVKDQVKSEKVIVN
jgi:hypothetical protein